MNLSTCLSMPMLALLKGLLNLQVRMIMCKILFLVWGEIFHCAHGWVGVKGFLSSLYIAWLPVLLELAN